MVLVKLNASQRLPYVVDFTYHPRDANRKSRFVIRSGRHALIDGGITEMVVRDTEVSYSSPVG